MVAAASTEVGPPRGRKTFVDAPRHFVGHFAAKQGAGNGRGLVLAVHSFIPTDVLSSELSCGSLYPRRLWDTIGEEDPRQGTEGGAGVTPIILS